MNRDNITTFWAFILLFVVFQEFPNALLLQFPQILNHVHIIALSVTSIQTIKICARHVLALITEFDFIAPKFGATSFEVAVLVDRKTTLTMNDFASFLGDSS